MIIVYVPTTKGLIGWLQYLTGKKPSMFVQEVGYEPQHERQD
jgi:hypothetical protein